MFLTSQRVESSYCNPDDDNSEERKVKTKFDKPALLLSIKNSEDFSDINKMLLFYKQHHNIASNGDCNQEHEPMLCQEEKRTEDYMHYKLRDNQLIDAR